MQKFLHPSLKIEKLLVLSAISRENELIQTINLFNQLGIESTIFTKIDEAERHGAIINHLMETNLPVSFLTNGQNVPEDIEAAGKGKIAKLV